MALPAPGRDTAGPFAVEGPDQGASDRLEALRRSMMHSWETCLLSGATVGSCGIVTTRSATAGSAARRLRSRISMATAWMTSPRCTRAFCTSLKGATGRDIISKDCT